VHLCNLRSVLSFRFDTYFSAERPRPPSPPIGPTEHFKGAFNGNEYEGAYLPWKVRARTKMPEKRVLKKTYCVLPSKT